MIRLHITAEGDTEERFAKLVLIPHLANFQIYADVRRVLTCRRNSIEYRGGFRRHASFLQVKKDIQYWMLEEQKQCCVFTTMFDFYALPHDFPCMSMLNDRMDKYEQVELLEEGLFKELQYSRFIPYIQLHEFEALLFVDPQKFDWEYLEHDNAISELIKISNQFENPELINCGSETAPSKRIIKHIPEHRKNKLSGANIAASIGLDKLRNACPHFNVWLNKLENLRENKTLTF